MKKSLRLVLALASLSLLPNLASAQGRLEDRSRTQGPGFRVGSLVLHPGFGAEVGYDTNVFYEDSDGTLPQPAGALIFRFTPHLNMSNEAPSTEGEAAASDPQRVLFSAGISTPVHIFLQDDVAHNVGLNGSFDLNFNPKGRFGFQLSDKYSRRVRPFTSRTEEGRVRDYGLNNNTVSATLHGRSRGGVISASLGYAFQLQYFEGRVFRYANTFGHNVTSAVHYKFLPNTSLFWSGDFDRTNYYNDGGPLALSDSWRVSTRVGLNGVVTPKISVTASVGYTAAFIEDPRYNDFDSVIAEAGLRWRVTPTTQFALGYERSNQGSIVGLYRVSDRGYLRLSWLYGGAFLLGFDTSVAYLQFGDVRDAAGVISDEERTDVMVMASLFAEYRFTNYLAMNANLAYVGDFTDFEYAIDTGTGPIADPAGFHKFEAWLGLRVFY